MARNWPGRRELVFKLLRSREPMTIFLDFLFVGVYATCLVKSLASSYEAEETAQTWAP